MSSKAYQVIGCLAYFIREGTAFTSPSAGAVSRTAKPDENDTGWLDLGNVRVKSKRTVDREEIYRPTPGGYRRDAVIENKAAIDIKVECMELHNLVWEGLWGADELPNSPTAGGQWNPNGGTELNGWLKLQFYGRDNTLINAVDVYVNLAVEDEVEFGEKRVSVTFMARDLYSTLATGTLA